MIKKQKSYPPGWNKESMDRYEYLNLLRAKEEQLKIEEQIKKLETKLNIPPSPSPIPQLDPEDTVNLYPHRSLLEIIKSIFKK